MDDADLDEIWDHAYGVESSALRTHPGDEALHVALGFHGSAMTAASSTPSRPTARTSGPVVGRRRGGGVSIVVG